MKVNNMALDFQFEFVSAILLLRDYQGNVIKTSKKLPDEFYYMQYLGNNNYYNSQTNHVWNKKTSTIIHNGTFYLQEEYTDITELWNQKEELLSDLETDVLTQISNFRAVQKKKNEIISSGKNCVLVMCDMNSFKSINDIYGHVMGDKCLVETAKIFNRYISAKDLVARVGGDEFLFIFETNDVESVTEKMKAIQEEVAELGNSLDLPLSICVGISLFENGDDWDRTREQADLHSYQNKAIMKKIGRNRTSPKNE